MADAFVAHQTQISLLLRSPRSRGRRRPIASARWRCRDALDSIGPRDRSPPDRRPPLRRLLPGLSLHRRPRRRDPRHQPPQRRPPPPPITGTLPNMSGVIKYYVSSVDTAKSPEITRLVYEDNAGTTSPLVSLNHGYMEHIEYMRHGYYKKLTLSPSLDTAVAIHCPRRPDPRMGGQRQERLAFARLGGDDTSSSWTDLPWFDYSFNNIIFHKGRFHAVDSYGTLYVYDIKNPSAEPFVSPEGPLLQECTTLGMHVVESEDGNDIFLVFRDMFWFDDDQPRTQGFKVFKLNKRYNKWNQVDSVGGLALFVGFNHTSSLSARDFHGLKPNCIYFTDDYHDCVQNPQLFGDTGVYNLKDGSIQFFQLTDSL